MTAVRARTENQVMYLLLDGAETMNSLSPSTLDDFERALDAAEADRDLRAVVVAEDARVGDVHLQFGVPAGAGASQRAARKLGDQKAKALMLTSMWLDGPTMVEWGLAFSAVPRQRLDDEVERLVAAVRGRSRPTIAVTKLAIGAAQNLPLEEGLRYERELFEKVQVGTADADEGFRAYVERRDPHWGSADVQQLR